MHKIKLVTDSTCDLSPDLIEIHQIEVVPLYVNFKDESYRDNVDLKTEEMYRLVRQKGYLPKTSATSPGAFTEVFTKYLDEGYDIIYTGIGKKLSATFQSAYTAKQLLQSDRIYLVDSENLSSGSGLLLLKAAKFRDAGCSASEIALKLQEIVPKVRSQFIIDTLEYLHKGGRLNALSAMMGTMLRVKPIIKVRDGVLNVGKKPRGNIRVGIDLMLQELFQMQSEVDPDFLMITHSLAYDSARYIKERLHGQVSLNQIYETDAGCVISSHCGPGTIGILYILK
ncbi:MAG: DegV family protein [Candidatus Izemoplasmatales bacterium]|jgi:DegV family protein with EDD domain